MRPDQRRDRALVVACGVLGPLMLAAYFAAPFIAAPLGRLLYAAHPATAQVVDIGRRYHELLYIGSWLQPTGALLAVIFFLALVGMASAPGSLAARIVQLGAAALVAVVLAEARLSAAVRRAPIELLPVVHYSSPENRSHADWRVIPSASPIRVQVTPRLRAWSTQAVRCCCT